MERSVEVRSVSGVRTGCVGRGFPGAGHGETGRRTEAPGARREADGRAAARVALVWLICGLPSWPSGEECSCQHETWRHSWTPGSGGPPGGGNGSHPSVLAWESHAQRGLAGCSPWGRRARHD